MTPSFSDAALDRIAQCYDARVTVGVASGPHDEPARMRDVVDRLVAEGRNVTATPVFDEASWRTRYAEWLAIVGELFGLAELGVAAGYIDLAELDGAYIASLRTASSALLRGDRSDDPLARLGLDTRSVLAKRFLARLDRLDVDMSGVDPALFGAYESYVALTSVVALDTACLRFLIETRDGASFESDDAFLRSPHDFADALWLGIDGKAAPGVAGGLAALKHFDGLSRLLDDVASAPSFHDDLIRHARWSYGALSVNERITHWADRMRGWPSAERTIPTQDAWDRYRERVFTPLVSAQIRLGVLHSETRVVPPIGREKSQSEDASRASYVTTKPDSSRWLRMMFFEGRGMYNTSASSADRERGAVMIITAYEIHVDEEEASGRPYKRTRRSPGSSLLDKIVADPTISDATRRRATALALRLYLD